MNTILRPAPAVAVTAERHVAEPLVLFEDVRLVLSKKLILDDIDLTVRRGDFLCIVGSSGCGKTTMLRLVAGLLKPSEGRVEYEGQPIAAPSRRVAMVFQDYSNALLPWRTAAGNVSLALERQGLSAADRKNRIAALLEKVGLGEHSDKFPNQLSGGMQQRLQIARCLAQDPSVLLMDEPFGALDALTRRSLQDELLRIVEESGATVLFVTHDLEEAIYLGNRVVAMDSYPGRIVKEYAVDLPRPRSQLETPDHPEFRRIRHELYSFFQDHS